MNYYVKLLLVAFTGVVFTGCSSGGDSNSPTSTTITAVDGYIKNATVKDSSGQIATYISQGRYSFANSPQYPLTLTGGMYVDTNVSFDINMTAQSGLVISPITTFLS